MNRQNAGTVFVPPDIKTSSEGIPLDENSYQFLSSLMLQQSGVFLDDHKKAMIQTRLSKRLTTLRLNSFADYCQILKNNKEELIEFLNTLTTHKTDFFREPDHFVTMKDQVLPEITSRKNRPSLLTVWSAAASSGEEVYTITMVLREFFATNPGLAHWNIRVLGTDLDTSVLAKCENGVYSSEVVSPVPPGYLQKYFLRGTGPNSGKYRVRADLKKDIKFRRHNLLDVPAFLNGLHFDIIFLRNVLIYFQEETRQLVISRIESAMAPNGYLFVGHSESLHGVQHTLRHQGQAIYRKS